MERRGSVLPDMLAAGTKGQQQQCYCSDIGAAYCVALQAQTPMACVFSRAADCRFTASRA